MKVSQETMDRLNQTFQIPNTQYIAERTTVIVDSTSIEWYLHIFVWIREFECEIYLVCGQESSIWRRS